MNEKVSKLYENLRKSGMRIVSEVSTSLYLTICHSKLSNSKLPPLLKTLTPFWPHVPCLYLPPALALLPGGEAAGVGVAVHGQLRPVAPQHVRLGGGPTHGQVLLCKILWMISGQQIHHDSLHEGSAPDQVPSSPHSLRSLPAST